MAARPLGPILAERLPAALPQRLPERQRRFREAGFYVDGRLVGVLRRAELPPAMKVRQQRLLDGREVPRFAFSDYLDAIGVDLASVRQMHVYGGRNRASIVEGDELRRLRERLTFSFTRGDRGKARMEWPDEPVRVNTTIDVIVAVAVYRDKLPPTYVKEKRYFAFDDGVPIEGIPYAPPEDSRGTRVYSDGRLVAIVKRRTLPNSVLVPGAGLGRPRFSLDAYLASVGVQLDEARTIELVAGDDVIARFAASAWRTEGERLAFSLPRRSQGQIAVRLPAANRGSPIRPQAPEAVVKVSSVQVFSKSTPPQRAVVPIDDEAIADPDGSSAIRHDDDHAGDLGSARPVHESAEE